ncbi:MAG TPA: hypothetical protein VFO47_06605, partial [Actinomycetes bacterium]|nr:hypothetical protein [Actinomycetes bacterium]
MGREGGTRGGLRFGCRRHRGRRRPPRQPGHRRRQVRRLPGHRGVLGPLRGDQSWRSFIRTKQPELAVVLLEDSAAELGEH